MFKKVCKFILIILVLIAIVHIGLILDEPYPSEVLYTVELSCGDKYTIYTGEKVDINSFNIIYRGVMNNKFCLTAYYDNKNCDENKLYYPMGAKKNRISI